MIALVACFMIMVIILAVLAMIVVKALTHSPWGTYTVAFTIPLALFMGIYLRYLRPGRIGEVWVIGLVFLIFAIISGGWVAESPTWAPYFDFTGVQLTWMLVGYGFVAAVLPVWLLLAPRDYLSTFLKIGTIVGLAVGILIMRPTLTMPALTKFVDGTGPVWTGDLFPVPVYHHRLWRGVRLPCADLFRHHAEDAGERRAGVLYRLRWNVNGILRGDYGAGFRLYHDPGVYFAMNSPMAVLGSGRDGGCGRFCRAGGESWGFSIRRYAQPDCQRSGEQSIISRAGGAPTLAVGMAYILHGALGGMMDVAFWYHFAILFEALFILTAVDAGTRAARFMLQDLLGVVFSWPEADRFTAC